MTLYHRGHLQIWVEVLLWRFEIQVVLGDTRIEKCIIPLLNGKGYMYTIILDWGARLVILCNLLHAKLVFR